MMSVNEQTHPRNRVYSVHPSTIHPCTCITHERANLAGRSFSMILEEFTVTSALVELLDSPSVFIVFFAHCIHSFIAPAVRLFVSS
jgi:hypothetical protein